MPRALRAVGPDEKAPEATPKNLVEAADLSRRAFLVAARKRIGQEIDSGNVPAHALGRLISEMERLDAEVRRLDAIDEQEAGAEVRRGAIKFDAEAI